MQIGDLVCWHDKRSLLGVVIEVARAYNHIDTNPWTACKVQWTNGVRSTHSSRQLIKIESSEEQ